MNGYDVVRSINSNPTLSQIPVVTALDSPERKLALQAGAQGFLTKPLDRAQLSACLTQFLPSAGA